MAGRASLRRGSSTGTGWRTESGTNTETSNLQDFMLSSKFPLVFSLRPFLFQDAEASVSLRETLMKDVTFIFFGSTLLSAYFKRIFSFSSCLQSFCLSPPRATELMRARLKRQIMAQSRAPVSRLLLPRLLWVTG